MDDGMIGYVYETKNLVNGKMYISQHAGEFTTKYIGSGTRLLRAIDKYGMKSFVVEALIFCASDEELDRSEKAFIAHYWKVYGYEMMYNIHEGGHKQGRKGSRHSEVTRKLMSDRVRLANAEGRGKKGKKWSSRQREKYSASAKGRIIPAETREKIRKTLSGRKLTEDHKKHCSLSHLGKKFSLEHIENMSRARKGRKFSEEHKKALSLARAGKVFGPYSKERIEKTALGRKISIAHKEALRMDELLRIKK